MLFFRFAFLTASALFVLVLAQPAKAEPETIFFRYVQALTSNNTAGLKEITTTEQYRNIIDNKGGLSSDLKLPKFGNVRAVRIESSRVYADFVAYVAVVEHAKGHNTWLFRLDTKGERIANAVQLASTLKSAGSMDWVVTDIDASIMENANTNLQHNDMRDTGPDEPADAINDMLNKFLGIESSDRREVDFLFATDRTPASGQSFSFAGVRNSTLAFGAVTVRIPETHQVGKVELPSVWRLFSYEIYREKQNDKKHFSLKRAAFLSERDFDSLIREHNRKSALIFVHGFNNSFENAVYRNAQMLWDLKYDGLPVLYSWGSKGDGVSDYGFDRDSALFARDGFIKLVQKLQNELQIERIDVLAHSMGNLVVIDALSTNALTAKPVQLDQLVMAAPDIELEGFKKTVPVLKQITKGMTLYASSADKALLASSALQKFPRAGGVPADGPVSLPDLDTIDVSKLGDEFLGLNHSTFAENRAVMDDLKLLLAQRMKSPRLSQIHPFPEPPQTRRYWRYE